jgi:hypothetical protein
MPKFAWAIAAAVVVASTVAASASAHQTAVNNGVAVTMHVTPNDEPIAEAVSQILVPRVKARNAKFSWATCRCRLTIMDSSGATLFKSAVRPRTDFTFPEAAAYSLTFAGRVKNLKGNKLWRPFKVTFAIRAFAPEG